MNMNDYKMTHPFIIIGTLLVSNNIYRFATKREDVIFIKNKHMLGNFINKYNIISYSNDRYIVNNYKDWNNIKNNTAYHIKYWGLDMPVIGLNRRIYKINEYSSNMVYYDYDIDNNNNKKFDM